MRNVADCFLVSQRPKKQPAVTTDLFHDTMYKKPSLFHYKVIKSAVFKSCHHQLLHTILICTSTFHTDRCVLGEISFSPPPPLAAGFLSSILTPDILLQDGDEEEEEEEKTTS